MDAFVVPLTIRHFHKPSGRLIATVVAAPVGGGRVAVGIARCNSKDRPSRAKGRELARARLARGMGVITSVTQKADLEADKNLFKVMTEKQFKALLEENPFKDWACPFGVFNQDLVRLKSVTVAVDDNTERPVVVPAKRLHRKKS